MGKIICKWRYCSRRQTIEKTMHHTQRVGELRFINSVVSEEHCLKFWGPNLRVSFTFIGQYTQLQSTWFDQLPGYYGQSQSVGVVWVTCKEFQTETEYSILIRTIYDSNWLLCQLVPFLGSASISYRSRMNMTLFLAVSFKFSLQYKVFIWRSRFHCQNIQRAWTTQCQNHKKQTNNSICKMNQRPQWTFF